MEDPQGPFQDDYIVKALIDGIIKSQKDNIIAVYGVGSYFDESLPKSWEKGDIDLIVFVKDLEKIPPKDFTKVRYEKKELDWVQVWIGYNTIDGFQNKEKFKEQSFSNLEWSVIELKHPENSTLLYGKDIRKELPSIESLKFDYDDILARGLYHLNKSLRLFYSSEKDVKESVKEWTKSVFKFCFYLCILKDESFRSTSKYKIAKKVQELVKGNRIEKRVLLYLTKAIQVRKKGKKPNHFKSLLTEYVLYLFSLLGKGNLHRKMDYHCLKNYFINTYAGLDYLDKFLEKVRKKISP
jgi:hypothetical protein